MTLLDIHCPCSHQRLPKYSLERFSLLIGTHSPREFVVKLLPGPLLQSSAQMAGEAQPGNLHRDESYYGRNDNDEIPFVTQESFEGVVAAFDVKRVVAGCAHAAKSRWTAVVGILVDTQTLGSIGECGRVSRIDDDSWGGRHATTWRYVAGNDGGSIRRSVSRCLLVTF